MAARRRDEAGGGRVLLCATGSVAGVKVPSLVRALEARDCAVTLSATEHGATFVRAAPDFGKLAVAMHVDGDEVCWRCGSPTPPRA